MKHLTLGDETPVPLRWLGIALFLAGSCISCIVAVVIWSSKVSSSVDTQNTRITSIETSREESRKSNIEFQKEVLQRLTVIETLLKK